MKRAILIILIPYALLNIMCGQELFRFIDYDKFKQDLRINGASVFRDQNINYENLLYLSRDIYYEIKNADPQLYIDTTNCFVPVSLSATRDFDTDLKNIKDFFYDQNYFNQLIKDLPMYQKDSSYKIDNEIFIKDNSAIFTIDYYSNFSVTYRTTFDKEKRKIRVEYLYCTLED